MAASAGIDPTSFVGVKRKMVHALRSGAATSDGRAGSFVTPLAGVAFGQTVDVFGMVVRSGDLVHADRHGAVVIPHAVAGKVAAAAQLCGRREEPILKVARSKDFSLEALERAMAEAAEIH